MRGRLNKRVRTGLQLLGMASTALGAPAVAAEQPLSQNAASPASSAAAPPASTEASDVSDEASPSDPAADVIVTARRREETLQSTPVSVSAVTSRDLIERGLRDISDIALITPGFSMQNIQSGTEQPFIRGMSTTSFERTLQTASTLVDGNYFSVLGRTVFFPDVERVEVVRGPQAALFGRATFAGAINYVMKRPRAELGGEARLDVGSFGLINTHASAHGPIAGDRLMFRVSATSERYGGEYRNQLDGQKTGVRRHEGVTGALRFVPTDRLTIDLKAFGTRFRDTGMVPEYIQGAASLNCFPNASGVNTFYCGELKPDPLRVRLNLNLVDNGRQNTDQTRVLLNADWRIGDFTLTSTSTYARQTGATFCDCDYSEFVSVGGAFHSDFVGKITNRSQEIRLQSPVDRPIRAMIGGYLFGENSYSYRANAATIVIPFVEVRTQSVFGSLEFDVTRQLTLSLDGRYQSERQTRTAIPGNPAIDITYNAFLPRGIVEYRASDDVMLYASAAKGNQPGQFNAGANVPAANVLIDSESLWSYEIGAKTSLFDRRLRLNGAAYRIDWDNQVYSTQVVGNNNTLINILANLGASRIKGIELEASAAIARGLTANATFAYIDARYVDFRSANANRVYGNPQVKGRKLPNTPSYQASFSSQYRVPVSSGYDYFLRGDYSYRGKQYVSEVNEAYIGAIHMLNASTGIENGRLRVAVRVDNILNSDVPEFATRFTDLNSPALSRFGFLLKLRPSRSAGLSLQYKFGGR